MCCPLAFTSTLNLTSSPPTACTPWTEDSSLLWSPVCYGFLIYANAMLFQNHSEVLIWIWMFFQGLDKKNNIIWQKMKVSSIVEKNQKDNWIRTRRTIDPKAVGSVWGAGEWQDANTVRSLPTRVFKPKQTSYLLLVNQHVSSSRSLPTLTSLGVYSGSINSIHTTSLDDCLEELADKCENPYFFNEWNMTSVGLIELTRLIWFERNSLCEDRKQNTVRKMSKRIRALRLVV